MGITSAQDCTSDRGAVLSRWRMPRTLLAKWHFSGERTWEMSPKPPGWPARRRGGGSSPPAGRPLASRAHLPSDKRAPMSFLCKGTNPTMGAPPSWSNLNLVTSRHHTVGLGLQYTNSERRGRKDSDHNMVYPYDGSFSQQKE